MAWQPMKRQNGWPWPQHFRRYKHFTFPTSSAKFALFNSASNSNTARIAYRANFVSDANATLASYRLTFDVKPA